MVRLGIQTQNQGIYISTARRIKVVTRYKQVLKGDGDIRKGNSHAIDMN